MNTTTLVAVPEGGSALDVLAMRYRAAFDKVNGGRDQWIEGTFEFAAVILDARELLPVHQEYGRWLTRHQLEHLSPNDRRALIGFGEMHRKDPEAARQLLEKNCGHSWRNIWEKKVDVQKGALITKDKGPFSPKKRHASGSDKRKRRNVIPDVMREDHVPGTRSRSEPLPSRRRPRPAPEMLLQDKPPAPVRKGVILKGLTREQVDPDFVGTSVEFATKYGHVNLHTKQQIEQTKRQEELMAWLGLVSDHDRTARALLAATVDPETLREWMSKPAKAEKLRTWFTNIERAFESLRKCEAVPCRP